MSDNDPASERSNGYLAAKLARLERLLEEQSARLRVVERQLGLDASAQATRPFGQGSATQPNAPANEQRESAPPPFSVTDDTTQTTRTTAPPSVTAPDTDEAFSH